MATLSEAMRAVKSGHIKEAMAMDDVRVRYGKEVSSALTQGRYYKDTFVLFIDICGYTKWVRSMESQGRAKEYIGAMNSFFNIVSPKISEHGGVVDKYIGDCVMGIFGGPFSGKDSPIEVLSKAVKSCMEIFVDPRIDMIFKKPTCMSAGLAFGEVFIGPIGSSYKSDGYLEYTVMGGVVNTASRYQSIADDMQLVIPPLKKGPMQFIEKVLANYNYTWRNGKADIKGIGNQRPLTFLVAKESKENLLKNRLRQITKLIRLQEESSRKNRRVYK